MKGVLSACMRSVLVDKNVEILERLVELLQGAILNVNRIRGVGIVSSQFLWPSRDAADCMAAVN